MSDFHPIPGFEGLYEIAIDGRVRSLPRVVRSRGGTRIVRARELKTRLLNGYPSASLRANGKNHQVFIHRALATLFVANPERKPCVNHIDGNKANFSLENLEWCTHLENMRHAFRTGLAPYPSSGPGDLSPAAKLDWPKVRQIRELAGQGVRRDVIARQFGCSKSNINQIVRQDIWREAAA